MSKGLRRFLLVVVLGAAAGTHAAPVAPAHARPAFNDADYLRGARAVIQPFLDQQAAEFGVDLRPDPTTWVVHYPFFDLLMDAFAITHPYYFVGAEGLASSLCRMVTVELPARASRARFYVIREGADRYRLVGSCRDQKDPAPRMQLEALAARTRPFPKREFAARAMPLVQNYLKLNGVTTTPDWTSVKIRRGQGWIAAMIESPVNDCRAFDVRINGARVRTYVSVQADQTHFLPDVPLALQSLLKDPATLRSYRFAVVKGCAEADQRVPPPLNPPDPSA